MSSFFSAYIDPGTGSMLFAVLVTLLSAGLFFTRKLLMRVKFLFTGGRTQRGAYERASYVIFSEGKQYWNVFKPVCDEFERRGIDVVFWTSDSNDPALSHRYEHVKCEFIGVGNKAWARLNTMRADICLATTPGLDVYQWKRSKSVSCYVHMLHSVGTTAGYRMFGLDFYDAVLLSGAFQAREVRELEQLRDEPPKDLAVVGCTYLDAMKTRLNSAVLPDTRGRKVILLAPSWGPSSLLRVYGARLIDALLSTCYEVVIRPHPQSMQVERGIIDPLIERYKDNPLLKWNFDADNFDCLSRADVLVTDFSGIIYDFALVFDKPVIYADENFDPAVYDASWFDHPLRKFDHYPKMGIVLRDGQLDHMKELIEQAITSKQLARGRREVRDEAWQHRGKSASEIVDYLIIQLDRISLEEKIDS